MKREDLLIARYVEDRESLSAGEMDALLSAVRNSPELLVRLRQQLQVDEAISQRLAVDRRNFAAQVDQRVRDLNRGDEELYRQVQELRALVSRDLEMQPAAVVSWQRRITLAAVAVSLLLALALGMWSNLPQQQQVAVVDGISGRGTLIRDGRQVRIEGPFHLQAGDRIQTDDSQSLAVAFADGTRLRIYGDSLVQFGTSPAASDKQIRLMRGEVGADVARQPEHQPMLLTTPVARAVVVGTRFWLRHRGGETELDVTEGKVRLSRRNEDQSLLIAAGEVGIVRDQQLEQRDVSWPSNRNQLALVFETADKTNGPRHLDMGACQPVAFQSHGYARWTRDFAMRISRGGFVARDGVEPAISACRASGQMSLEMTIAPLVSSAESPLPLIALGSRQRSYLQMVQQADRLRLRLPGSASAEEAIDLCRLQAAATQHVVLTYGDGVLTTYVDGIRVGERVSLKCDLTAWRSGPLVIGGVSESSGAPAKPDSAAGPVSTWSGTLEGLAIYSRLLSDEEAAENARRYGEMIQRRSVPPRYATHATLIEKAPNPNSDLWNDQPTALVVDRYRVDHVADGNLEAAEIDVARFARLNGLPLPDPQSSGRLQIEPFGDHPELAGFLCVDPHEQQRHSVPLFFAVQSHPAEQVPPSRDGSAVPVEPVSGR